MSDFDLKKYLAEGELYKDENKPTPKFKIGDLVEFTPEYLPLTRFKRNIEGEIHDIYINKSEILQWEDGEYVYNVNHVSYRVNMAMSYNIKESNLKYRGNE